MAFRRRKSKAKTAPALHTEALAVTFAPPVSVISFLEKYAVILAIVAVMIASARIIATYNVFGITSDEPIHIACGLEWLDKGKYTGEAQHPPLARIASAIGPYLLGAHSAWTKQPDPNHLSEEGFRIIASGGRPDRMLASARAGVLPFFWIACGVIFAWGRRYCNGAVAVLAVWIFSFTPTVLAHAGLATTDMALTAFLSATFLASLIWLERPTLRNAALLGVCGALAVLSKFSSLVFFPAAAGAAFLWYVVGTRPSRADLIAAVQQRWKTLALSALICSLVIWTGYRFSFGKVYFADISLPAPELFFGVHVVNLHNIQGHDSFLLGQIGRTGWWYFFPVALAVKTPLALLLLLGVWGWLYLRRGALFIWEWLPLAFSLAILLVGMSSRINLGLRHILPVYLGFALLGGLAAFRLLQQARVQRAQAFALVVLCGWFSASTLMAHPDYLAYFNELAGDHPENIIVDSDLDWGQDFKRLAKRLKELKAQNVTVITAYDQDYKSLGISRREFDTIDAVQPDPGWTALSISYWKITRMGLFQKYPTVKTWPDLIPPTERIGKGMLLWYIPPGSPAPSEPASGAR